MEKLLFLVLCSLSLFSFSCDNDEDILDLDFSLTQQEIIEQGLPNGTFDWIKGVGMNIIGPEDTDEFGSLEVTDTQFRFYREDGSLVEEVTYTLGNASFNGPTVEVFLNDNLDSPVYYVSVQEGELQLAPTFCLACYAHFYQVL